MKSFLAIVAETETWAHRGDNPLPDRIKENIAWVSLLIAGEKRVFANIIESGDLCLFCIKVLALLHGVSVRGAVSGLIAQHL